MSCSEFDFLNKTKVFYEKTVLPSIEERIIIKKTDAFVCMFVVESKVKYHRSYRYSLNQRFFISVYGPIILFQAGSSANQMLSVFYSRSIRFSQAGRQDNQMFLLCCSDTIKCFGTGTSISQMKSPYF